MIVDDKDLKEIVGVYDIDDYFIDCCATLRVICCDWQIAKVLGGKIITDRLPYIDQCVLSKQE